LWLVAGVVLAVGLYTKSMMMLAAPCLLAGLWFSRDKRSQLRRAGPWVACAVGAGLFLPAFLAWNWVHGWPSVAYHLSQRHTWVFQSKRALIYLSEHAALYSPVLYAAVLAALVAGWRARKRVGARVGVVGVHDRVVGRGRVGGRLPAPDDQFGVVGHGSHHAVGVGHRGRSHTADLLSRCLAVEGCGVGTASSCHARPCAIGWPTSRGCSTRSSAPTG
jgi:hypothetical protein